MNTPKRRKQWSDFTSITIETAPQMLIMQGQAFLKKLEGLSKRALEMLPPATHVEELRVQWQDTEVTGEALADALDLHRSRRNDLPEWQAMHKAIGHLAQRLLDQRKNLRTQLAAAEGQVLES